MENPGALIAALAASIAVFAHGVVGYRWLLGQLQTISMRPTELSVRLFGADDVSAQVLGVTWHAVTATFIVTAGALYLTAFGALESSEVLRFIAVVHVAILAVGLVHVRRRLDLFGELIPLTFSVTMLTTAVFAWIASNSA